MPSASIATSAPPPVSFFISVTTSHCFGSSTTLAPIRFDISIRTGSLSTPNERGAHQLRARRCAETYRPLRKNGNGIADPNVRRFRTAEPGRGNIGEQDNLFVAEFIWNFREIGLGVGNEQKFRLRAVDGVAESPAADGFDAFAVAALRPLPRIDRRGIDHRA